MILLADVFETFRDLCMTKYELDPAWYYTAPGLTWDAALKMTKVELELLTDIEILDMAEEGIRGGVSSIINKDFFKLMNNFVFDKTMENIRKHVNIKLVNNEKQAKKLAAK